MDSLSGKAKTAYEQSERIVELKAGEFNEWVGYAPVFKSDANPGVDIENFMANVRFPGYGETGRLMGMFIQHKMIEGAGEAACDAPFYSRKLWDDRGSWFSAPSIRSLADIALTVAVAVATGPGALGMSTMLAAAGANMIDDAIFTMMDIANGLDAGDALQGFAKKGLVSVATSFIGAKINGVVNIVDKAPVVTGGLAQALNVGDSVMSSTLLKGAEIMASNIASSAINALDFEAMFKGRDFFDERGFNEGAFGKGAMTGVVAGMAGNFVSGSFNSAMKSQSFAGFSSTYTNGIKNLGATLGGLASTGVTYGMTGNATVNLLNMSMFSDKLNTGLFELSFGKDGVHGAIGMGGTDLNVGKLVSSLNGINALYQNGRINDYAAETGLEANVALRTLFSYGDSAGRETYSDIFRGDTKLAVDKNLADNAMAKTVDNGNGTKTIFLTSLSNNVNAGVNAGIVLQHEAYRDGVDSGDQEAETRSSVRGHTEMAIRVRDDKMYVNAITYNQNLTNDIAAYESGSAAFDAYANKKYDSSGDYWRVTKDANGKVVKVQDDGDRNNITVVSATGEIIKVKRNQLTLSEQIAQINGDEPSVGKDAMSQVMIESGLYYNDRDKWHVKTNEGRYTPTYLDYMYPGIIQKETTESIRRTEEAEYRA